MEVVNPMGAGATATSELAPHPGALRGKTLGVLCNGKPNADKLLGALAQRFVQEHDMADVLWMDKVDLAKGPGDPCPEDLIDRLSSGTVAVLAASGD